MVVWLIGLSGAGKTTLARQIVARVRDSSPNVVLVDGDAIRELFGNDLGHSLEDRRRNAERVARLCKYLDDQGIHVVCAILSLFPETRDWCRRNFSAYYEVFINAPTAQLVARDAKGIYGRYERSEIRNVAGMDLHFPAPTTPDLVIRNDAALDALLHHAGPIADRIVGNRQ